jgi:hypothetical protein
MAGVEAPWELTREGKAWRGRGRPRGQLGGRQWRRGAARGKGMGALQPLYVRASVT